MLKVRPRWVVTTYLSWPLDPNAVSRSAVPAPAREEDEAGRGEWPPTRTPLHGRTASDFGRQRNEGWSRRARKERKFYQAQKCDKLSERIKRH
jgi:hypothetical protein